MSVHQTTVSPCDLDVRIRPDSLEFVYGPGVYGPPAEIRRLDAIRESLRDPECAGPEEIYGIVMDVAKLEHRRDLEQRHLLFGFVVYAPGLMGEEPVRSQGHVHAIAPHCGWSTPEVFEIWEGHAIIYAQQRADDDPGRCIAVQAGPGEKVVVPPGWAHCVINADPSARLLFCALCERQYGFVYDGVRSRHGLAWYPIVRGEGIAWERNEHYRRSELHLSNVRDYPELSISTQMSLYSQYETSPASLQWVSEPARLSDLWPVFNPGADS